MERNGKGIKKKKVSKMTKRKIKRKLNKKYSPFLIPQSKNPKAKAVKNEKSRNGKKKREWGIKNKMKRNGNENGTKGNEREIK